MTDLPVESIRHRPKSTQSRNYKSIQLHACLDEAKLYQEYTTSYAVASCIIFQSANFKTILSNLQREFMRRIIG